MYRRLRSLIDATFPAGTRATRPTGGFLLWVELPAGCDTNRLFDDALARGIGITPGGLYSPSGRYTRHLRLSGCYPFTERHLHALATLGELAATQLATADPDANTTASAERACRRISSSGVTETVR